MRLSDIQIPMDYRTATRYALVFSEGMAMRLRALHRTHGSTVCVPEPVPLVDGRCMVSADLLSEATPGGLLARLWPAIAASGVLDSVDVLEWSEALSAVARSGDD